MAFRSAETTVTTTPVKLFEAVAGDVEIWVNADPNATYYLGGSDVTTTNGLPMFGPSQQFRSHVRPGDELWAVSGGSVTVNVLVRSA
ncbi:hypothetical protein [Micromonospora aurantiaca (nom. illeg.)]|uniref:hypothetical protein n=1 Tax=Micromonospora aurantiaca (nom. illeg.) TaxID=47850 RepID=UPI0033F5E90B